MSPAIRCLWYFTLFSPLRTAACSGVLPSLSWRLNRLPLKYPGASPAAETKVRCKNLVKNTNIRGKSHQLKVRKWYFLFDFSHYTLLKCHCKLVVNFSHYKTLPRQETSDFALRMSSQNQFANGNPKSHHKGPESGDRQAGFTLGSTSLCGWLSRLTKRNLYQRVTCTFYCCWMRIA